MGSSIDGKTGPQARGRGAGGSTLTAMSAPIAKPDGYGRAESECGDTIEIAVAVDAGVITESAFRLSGCAFTLLCGRAAAEIIPGKTISEARRMTSPELIAAALDGLPEANAHCAALASSAVAEALTDAAANMVAPWKKHYRRLT
jgi:NifU-like protein involved in Fe-S cluster formation